MARISKHKAVTFENPVVTTCIICYKVTNISAFCLNVVGIAIRYSLDGPGIESRWGRDSPHPLSPTLGPPNLVYNG